MDEVEVAGLRIAYERTGVGPPLVLLHGFVGDARSTWSHQIEALSDQFTVVAWDAPGAGGSSCPPESFRLPEYADCLAGFLDELGLARVHLAGLSFGGALALQLFERHATVARSLVLLGGYAGWAGSLTPDEAGQRLATCLRFSTLPPEEFADAMVPSMFSSSAEPEVVERFRAAMVATFDPAGFRAMAHASAEADLRPLLRKVRVPTLLLYGDQDARAPLRVATDLHEALPGSLLVVLPGVGHLSPVEAPGQVTAQIRGFLREP
jgi:pimeloyl-ACP methyl ester carboxylesterase